MNETTETEPKEEKTLTAVGQRLADWIKDRTPEPDPKAKRRPSPDVLAALGETSVALALGITVKRLRRRMERQPRKNGRVRKPAPHGRAALVARQKKARGVR